MSWVRLRFNSRGTKAGDVVDLDEKVAAQLVADRHAVRVAAPAKPEPAKAPAPKPDKD